MLLIDEKQYYKDLTKKSRIRETLNLSLCAHISNDTKMDRDRQKQTDTDRNKQKQT